MKVDAVAGGVEDEGMGIGAAPVMGPARAGGGGEPRQHLVVDLAESGGGLGLLVEVGRNPLLHGEEMGQARRPEGIGAEGLEGLQIVVVIVGAADPGERLVSSESARSSSLN